MVINRLDPLRKLTPFQPIELQEVVEFNDIQTTFLIFNFGDERLWTLQGIRYCDLAQTLSKSSRFQSVNEGSIPLILQAFHSCMVNPLLEYPILGYI